MTRNDILVRVSTVVLVVLSLSVSGAQPCEAMAKPIDAISVTQADAGRTIALFVGDKLRVRLRFQGGTGYSWLLATGSTPLVTLESNKSEEGAAMPGGWSTQVLAFVAHASGRGLLRLEYRQPFDRTTPAGKRLSFTVNIAAR